MLSKSVHGKFFFLFFYFEIRKFDNQMFFFLKIVGVLFCLLAFINSFPTVCWKCSSFMLIDTLQKMEEDEEIDVHQLEFGLE